MSNSKWYAFKLRVFSWIASILPEGVRRQVLYDLRERVVVPDAKRDDYWDVTFLQVYETLRD